MSAAAFTINFDNTSDTTFRAWASAIDTQILALGWVHGTDSGQFNFSTGTRSTTLGANYVIYKTNDGLATIYLKVEYNSQPSASTSSPNISVTVGWATDGAGNLTGTLISPRFAYGVTTHPVSDTTARNCIISGSTGRLTMALNMNATTLANSIILSVERSKDSSGNDTATAAIITMIGGGTGNVLLAGATAGIAAQQYLPATGTAVPSTDMWLPVILSNAASGSSAFGTTIGVGVPIPLAGSAQNPGTNLLACLTTDYPTRDSTTTIALYGTNRTFYAVGPNWSRFMATAGTVATAASLFMRDD